ncbi:NUDIX domain-containing protein [Streptomyces sp. NPDC005438]|uniref:NUDIX domain-containing protein n=1 Tax=Streptomyces sp. NPDC005438 TaxID=3156880 RepID=UPI0033B2055B
MSVPPGHTLLVATVIAHDPDSDRLLLLRRGPRASFGTGWWDLPGGKHESGEPVTTTAQRELAEETGLMTAPESLRLVHVLHAPPTTTAPGGYLTLTFLTHIWTGHAHNREPDKHDHLDWFPRHALPAPLLPSTAQALRPPLHPDTPHLTLHGW